MSWTYSKNPLSSDRDAVRFKIGDTNSDDQQLSNEEITYLLTTYTSVEKAAVEAARTLIAKYARLVDKTVGDLSISYSQRLAAYKDLLTTLETGMLTSGALVAAPYAGGLTHSDKQLLRDDSDAVQNNFEIDTHDHPPATDPHTSDPRDVY